MPSLQPEKRSVVGLEGNDSNRNNRLRAGTLDLEGLDHGSQHQGRFSQREPCANAHSRADAERQIGEAIGDRRTREKPRRVEDFRLRPQSAMVFAVFGSGHRV